MLVDMFQGFFATVRVSELQLTDSEFSPIFNFMYFGYFHQAPSLQREVGLGYALVNIFY